MNYNKFPPLSSDTDSEIQPILFLRIDLGIFSGCFTILWFDRSFAVFALNMHSLHLNCVSCKFTWCLFLICIFRSVSFFVSKPQPIHLSLKIFPYSSYFNSNLLATLCFHLCLACMILQYPLHLQRWISCISLCFNFAA